MTRSDTVTYAYAADIVKYDKNPDGSLMVYGKAAGSELDMDQQILDESFLKAAMPEWMKWGNVREQHSPIAAGVGKELEEKTDGWYVKAHIVDPGSVSKVEKSVLKGFSVGIKGARLVKDAKAPKGRVVGGQIVELSLVDRPANSTATLMVCKAAGAGDNTLLPVDEAGEFVMDADAVHAWETVEKALSGDLIATLDDAQDESAAWDAIETVAGVVATEAIALLKMDKSAGTHDVSSLLDAMNALRAFIDTGDDAAELDDTYDGSQDMELDVAAYKSAMLDAESELVDDLVARVADRVDVIVEAALTKALGRDSDRDTDSGVQSAGENDNQTPIIDHSNDLLTKVAGLEAAIAGLPELQAKAAKVDTLTEELETLKKTAAVSDGPVLMTYPHMRGTAHQGQTSSGAERLRRISQQPDLDPDIARGYRELAAREEALANQ